VTVFDKTTRYYINLRGGVNILFIYCRCCIQGECQSAERAWYRVIFQRIVPLCKTLVIFRDTGCWKGGPENRVLNFVRFTS
jgi:hypothetical protein